MHISFGLNWFYGDKEKQAIDDGLLKLLVSIKSRGSLKSASEETRLSYRHAWGLIKKWETIFGYSLVTLQRGRNHGAKLTLLGGKLVQAHRMVTDKFQSEYQSIAEEIGLSLQEEIEPGIENHLKITASHGMAINFLNQLLQAHKNIKAGYDVHGSIESLRLLNQSSYDVAGFHYPLCEAEDSLAAGFSKTLAPYYRQHLNPDKYDLLLVATREQGIITDKKNNAKIKTLTDLSKRVVRFINRQHDSGTRIILDQLLAAAKVNIKSIKGYENEEFTHVAVAAMIASGAANAGFGIKAAARQFDLNFIPVIKEAYILAIDKNLSKKVKALLKDSLTSDQFVKTVNTYPGYDATHAGKRLDLEKLLTNRNMKL